MKLHIYVNGPEVCNCAWRIFPIWK